MTRGLFESRSPLLRFVLALACLAGAVALVKPAQEPARQRTWETLLQPLAVGRPVALGYVLGVPRRGEEHDIVLAGRSAETGSTIEVHILDPDRWSGIRETASFGVAYETPRSAAATADCEVVTEAVAQAIRANDPGGLGPVDTIALRSERLSPPISRMLDRFSGIRGIAAGLCLVGFTWILAAAPGGAWAVAIWLGLLGLFLRAPCLSVPFVHDQDVQRLFTGHLPLSEILFGQGLKDRHPPLYFLVLHAAQLFGQSEAVVRTPAVLFGALAGPSIVWGATSLNRRVDVAALAGLIATLSVELIARSREVSSIPLFALLSIVMSVSLVRHSEKPSPQWTAIVVASHALALWTYYLAPFLILGQMATMLALRRRPRATVRALGLGIAAGSPAIALAVVTFFRDRTARVSAAAHPSLAWGERGPGETARLLGLLAVSTLGVAVVGLFAIVAIRAVQKRDAAALVPIGGLVASAAAIIALAPVARVQAYYLTAVLPLAVLALSLGAGELRRPRGWPVPAVIGLSVGLAVVPALPTARALYLQDADAFMPAFAEIIADSPDRRIVPVAHYDATLLAYYLARRAGVPIDWARMQPEVGGDGQVVTGLDKVLEPLVQSHALPDDPDNAALEKLQRLMEHEAVLVIERDGFRLQRLGERLRACDLLVEVGTGRLYRCALSR